MSTPSARPLLARLPSAGAVATTSTNEALGITEWRLSNGVRVVLKPTMFKQDEILFRAVSPGGTSLASDQDFIPAETADTVIAQGGIGGLSRLDLDKVLAGTTASVRADIGMTEEGLVGGASRKDLETMFQSSISPSPLRGRIRSPSSAERSIEDRAGQRPGAAGRCSTRHSTPR